MKPIKWMTAAFQVAVTIVLALLLAANLYLIFMQRVAGVPHPTIGGYSVAVVASGSMEPALSVDDLILNHARDQYAEGDIITFSSGNSLTTHRIVAITRQGYVTQGDANNTHDPDTVPPQAVVGCVVARIPFLGKGIVFLKTPLGMTLLVLTGFLMIGLLLYGEERGN